LALEYTTTEGAGFEAAKMKLALEYLNRSNPAFGLVLLKEALSLLEPTTREAQQLQWDIYNRYAWLVSVGVLNDSKEQVLVKALVDEAGKNPALRTDPFFTFAADKCNYSLFLSGYYPFGKSRFLEMDNVKNLKSA
jgi:hypothetical protein